MFAFARSALRVYRSSFVGSFLVVVLAAALLSATGVLMESGLRGQASGSPLPLLAAVAASFAGTALFIVVLVVASTLAAALRQRHAQFAVLRAVGATPGQIRAMVTAEVAAVFLIAAPVGAVPGLFAANLLTPILISSGIVPEGFAPTITPLPALASLLLLFSTSLIAARLATRKIARISPVSAVQGSAAEVSTLSRGRRIAALVLAGSGLVVALTPVIVPGTVGSATGATSAFLLISAAAVAGPALVGWAARKAVGVVGGGTGSALVLAAANTRGFSRRLTAAVIPLSLFLALGSVQTGITQGTVDAAGLQLRAGLGADLVVSSPDGITPSQARSVADAPGVAATMASSLLPVSAKVEEDDQDLTAFNDLLWEATSLRTVAGDASGFLDPGVSEGSLAALSEPGTVAISSDATLGTGKGVGDTIGLRFDDGTETTATIAAVYERGLGFGDFLVDEQALPATQRPVHADMLFATTSPPLAAATTATLTAQGLSSTDAAGYAEDAVDSAASQQQLSSVLLLVLVLFIVLAAANTLVMVTVSRKPEFALLARVGATRGQLRLMVGFESLFVAVAALAIGTLSVVPALLGVGYGMLGEPVPAVDWPAYGLLALGVVVAALATMGVSAWSATRPRQR